MIKEIDFSEFEREVASADRPVVADFWAPWCGHCRRLTSMLERLDGEYGEDVSFVKINVDDNAALAEKYRVSSIPTLILFDGGEAKSALVAPESQAAAEKWLTDNGAL